MNGSLYDVDGLIHQEVEPVSIVLISILYIPGAMLIIVGNVFVLAAYFRDERIREKPTNTYILNLAVADFLVGVVMLLYIPLNLTNEWPYGTTACILVWIFDYTTTDMSVITITAISVDRYLTVRNALRHRSKQTRQKVGMVCALLWVGCLSAHASLAFGYSAVTKYVYMNPDTSCLMGYRRSKIALSLMFLVEFLIPATCVFALNFVVFRNMKERCKHPVGEQGPNDGSTVSCSASVAQDAMMRIKHGKDLRVHVRKSASGSQHRKAAKLLTIPFTVYVLCWLPFNVFDCYVLLHPSEEANVITSKIVNCILWLNSAVNPFLYAYSNIFFRQNFMHFLRIRKE